LADSFLILVPLLVLAVVLLLGFAGCEFRPGEYSSPLTFRVRASTDLTVLSPGVQFRWTKPDGTSDHGEVMMPVSGPSINGYIAAAITVSPPSLFWTLADVNGLHDQSGNGRDGTPLGGVTIGGDPDGPSGFADATATVFDGTDDGIGSSYDPFIGTAPRTFVGWAKWAAGGPAQYTLFGSSAGDADRPTLRVSVSNRNVVFLPSGSDGQAINWPAAAGPEDVWFMWTLVADPGNSRAILFIDGVRVLAQAMTNPWPAAPGNFQAAVGATSKQPFKGSQALVAVYEQALSDAQIGALYQASLGGVNVYEHTTYFPSSDTGSWAGACAMTVQADSQTAQGDSGDVPFDISTAGQHYVLTFQANGSPTAPPFTITSGGLTTE
jgi:hypothetical protein